MIQQFESTSTGRLRVTVIALHFAEYTWHLAKALAQRHDVLLVLDEQAARQELGELPTGTESLRVHSVTGFRSPMGAWRSARHLAQVAQAHRSHVVHFQDLALPVGFMTAWRLRHLPCVLTIHDPTPHSGDDAFSFQKIRQRLLLRALRRRADVAITHGANLQRDVEAHWPKLQGRTYSAPHGPLGDRVADVPSQEGNLLFFGRIQPYKGLGLFVEAVTRLHAAGVPVRGVIAGRGPDLEPHRRQIAEHPAFDLHERYIAADEVPGFFGRAQAVVLPYTDGTQSGVAAMALGFGRPVVSTRVGSVQEMVIDGRNGLLVAPGDADGLVAALTRVIQEPGLASKMAEQSIELGRGELSWARHADVATQAYTQALQLRGRRPKT